MICRETAETGGSARLLSSITTIARLVQSAIEPQSLFGNSLAAQSPGYAPSLPRRSSKAGPNSSIASCPKTNLKRSRPNLR